MYSILHSNNGFLLGLHIFQMKGGRRATQLHQLREAIQHHQALWKVKNDRVILTQNSQHILERYTLLKYINTVIHRRKTD